MKYKKGFTITNASQKILKKSSRKPIKLWIDQGSEFYKKSFKKMLEDNDINMYSPHNEEKFVVTDRFIKTLRNKIYKHMAAISKIFVLML